MENPFRFGQIVDGQSFCNRKNEISDIVRMINNRYSFWLYSPRRFGKTSLILSSFKQAKNVKCLYFDLYSIQSKEDFAQEYIKLISQSLFDWKQDLKAFSKSIVNYFKHLVPKISVDESGSPSLILDSVVENKTDNISALLDAVEKIAKDQNIKVCIAFDEFQEIKRIEPFLINYMRSSFQSHKHVSYIFLGSKESLMDTIFLDVDSPFYEFAQKFSIGVISKTDFKRFIKHKFKTSGLSIQTKTIDDLLDRSDCHPHFSQYFASAIWDLIYQGIDDNIAGFRNKWMTKIVNSQSIVFQNIHDQLNSKQRIALKTIALSNSDEIFSASVREKYGLPGSSTLAVNVEALVKKSLIIKQDKKYTFQNPVMKEWVIRLYN